ncbi:carbohydrate porin, partial [Planctomycetota bacterium]
DFYCPECRLPLRWDQNACPKCKTEFEPLRPRVRKGERLAYEPLRATDTQAVGPVLDEVARSESPFEEERPRSGEPSAPVDVTGRSTGRLIDEAWPQLKPPERSRFALGSYGRVSLSVDEDLNGAENRNVVDFAPRLSKSSYQELHFYYKDYLNELPVLVKTTLAMNEKLFHENGQFDTNLALREAYVEIEPTPDIALWTGARMYRGDDIYLFDVWPLDDQNTVGAGTAIRLFEGHRLQLHAGLNRIVEDSFFQFETVKLANEETVGLREAVFLNRYRLTGSTTYRIQLGDLGLKAHFELSHLPSGTRRVAGALERDERLPSETGFLVGGQVGYSFGPQSFARLTLSYAHGLSAYDELSVPFGFARDYSVEDASYLRVTAGGAIDSDYVGLHWGTYWQTFEDADGIPDRDDRDQLAFALRPLVYFGDYFRTGLEFSSQVLWTDGISPDTGEKETASVNQLYVLAGVAAGKGPFTRPAIYGFWGLNWLNEGAELELARSLADRPDRRSQVFGILAEWWF